MKKAAAAFVCLIMIFVFAPTAGAENQSAPSVSAESYILYCCDNGQTVCSNDENKQMKPASTTKLITTLITLEQAAAADKKVEFTEEMVSEGSSMYLNVGDVVRLSDLAAGMMMASGNDAANAAAVAISGSTEKFADLMNERAQQIGMKNSHFVTVNGLDDENHYSTAYDLALLMDYALENEDFASLTAQKSVSVSFIKPENKQTSYSNHNRLLSMYEYCIGGKTGYTMAAGRCLVSAARKNGITLVCVTLNDRNDWDDHIKLYEYGFSRLGCFESPDSELFIDVPCVGGSSNSVVVTGESNCKIVAFNEDIKKIKRKIYCDNFLYAPVKENTVVGKIDYLIDNETVLSTKLAAMESVEYK